MADTPKNFFLYARKSSDSEERQVRSIEDQISELRDFAEREGIFIKEIFTEAMTAKVTGRPIFNEMILKIVAGEAQGILAWHPDRLSRNLMDAARIVELLDKKYLLSLKFPTCRFENNSMDKFMLSIAFGQSKHFIDTLSENVKRGLHRKFKRGEWPGWAYMGYFNDKNLRKVVVHSVKGPLVKKMFQAAATGEYTLQDLRKITASWGLVSRSEKPLSKSEIHRLPNLKTKLPKKLLTFRLRSIASWMPTLGGLSVKASTLPKRSFYSTKRSIWRPN